MLPTTGQQTFSSLGNAAIIELVGPNFFVQNIVKFNFSLTRDVLLWENPNSY